MSDTNLYRCTPQRRSVLESDNDLMNIIDDLTQVVFTERFTTDDLRIELTDLQERFNATIVLKLHLFYLLVVFLSKLQTWN